MGTLVEDIKSQSEWIVKAFKADKLKLDYSLNSFKEIDKFFDKHAKDGKAVPGGRLSANLGAIIFSIGSYVGQTLIKLVPGAVWETDDKDPAGEANASVKFADGGMVWPMQKVLKRFMNGGEDAIYHYGYFLVNEQVKAGNIPAQPLESASGNKKPWWKFW
jgi:hypothetical protein